MRALPSLHARIKQLLSRFTHRKKSRGQSLVELALFLPILLILLSGLVEFGFALNRYVNVVEATREAARYGVDQDPDTSRIPRDLASGVSNMNCATTKDFYAKIACVFQSTVTPVTLDENANDNIIITVARVYRDPRCDADQTATPPAPASCTSAILPDPLGLWPNPSQDPASGEINGQWRLYNNQVSFWDRTRIQSYINANTVSNGVLIVEVWYHSPQALKLPWITVFVRDPIPFYTYAIVPLPAGEPRPTPTNTPTPTFTPTSTPTPPPLNCSAFGTSGVRQELWNGLPGINVADVVTGTNSFANAPNSVTMRGNFSWTTNITNSYGTRWRALVCIPQLGNYYFWIASDDASELRLNTTRITNPGIADWTALASGASPVALVSGSSGANQWNASAQQRSAVTYNLDQGFYYLEARHKQGTGPDHLSVGLSTPAYTVNDGDTSIIIPGSRLFPAAPLNTATPTPTFTPSPTPTPPCVANKVDLTRSNLTVSNSPQWSDNQSLMNVQVILNDNCGAAISDGRTVTLFTSRGISDTWSLNTRIANTYYFDVRSAFIGTTTFTATVNQDGPGIGPLLTIPLAPPNGSFVCVTGVADVSASPNSLQVLYSNPALPSLNRRLNALTITWPNGSGRTVNTVSFGNSANIIWNGPPANPPALTINSGQWTSINRNIVTGTSRPLQINFNGSVTPGSGTWTYTITASWDDGFGGSLCQSPPVTITLP